MLSDWCNCCLTMAAKRGLYSNIAAKKARGGKPRKPGAKGAPTAQAFKDAAKTAKPKPKAKPKGKR